MDEQQSEDFESGIFGRAFAELKAPEAIGKLATRATPFKSNGKYVHAGRDSEGNPHLLVPLLGEAVQPIEQLSASTAVTIRTLQDEKGEQQVFLDLTCLSSEADPLFAAICFDVCSDLTGSTTVTSSIAKSYIVETIKKWRAILDALAHNSVGKNSVTGLLGELLALRAFATKFGKGAINGWVGQDRARHDFEFENIAFEIKTSTSLSSKSCTVHGANQLSAAPGTELLLIHFQIEMAQKGISAASLVTELQDLGITREQLFTKIPKETLNLDDLSSWSHKLKFKVAGCSKYRVDAAFPAIRVNDLSEDARMRVSELQYKIRLDGLPEIAGMDSGFTWAEVVNFD
jgi:Putative  PD-(D/E)XK family member, (DUF4420)